MDGRSPRVVPFGWMSAMIDETTARVGVRFVGDSTPRGDHDLVAVEEPLEIRIGCKPVVVTMRTPGRDHELAAGFLWTEGVIRRADDIDSIKHCPGVDGRNVVTVRLARGIELDPSRLERNFYATSSCGICGKATLDAIHQLVNPIEDVTALEVGVVHSLPDRMRRIQQTFGATGGCHAAGAFSFDGSLRCGREDVGRHNAVDKVVGWAVQNRSIPLADTVLAVSGRASFEIVQKAAMAGIPVIAAVSAPSSLAIEAARRFRQTLIGFCRDGRFNVYHDPGRLVTR